MKIFIGQIYIKPGVSFPFSLHFQKWLGEELSACVEASEEFREVYPGEYNLIVRISARPEIKQPEIKGPTVFKRDKSVEFTIFLPYESGDERNHKNYSRQVCLILESMVEVLRKLSIDSEKVRANTPMIIEHFIASPTMIDSQ